MNTTHITPAKFNQWQAGNSQAQRQMLRAFRDRFFYVALKVLHNHCDADEAFGDAFTKLDRRVREGQVVWKSEGQLCALARQMVWQCAVDYYRAIKADMDYELTHRSFGIADDESQAEYVDRIADADILDPWEEEIFNAQAQARSSMYQDTFSAEFGPRDWRFWNAYVAMQNVPGHQYWGKHQINGFLKQELQDLGLSDNAFNAAHTRFRQKLEPLLCEWGLLHDITLDDQAPSEADQQVRRWLNTNFDLSDDTI